MTWWQNDPVVSPPPSGGGSEWWKNDPVIQADVAELERISQGQGGKPKIPMANSLVASAWKGAVSDVLGFPGDAVVLAGRGLEQLTGLPIASGKYSPLNVQQLPSQAIEQGLEMVGINTQSNDTWADRTVRFAAGSAIPAVGTARKAAQAGEAALPVIKREMVAGTAAGAGAATGMEVAPDSVVAPLIGAVTPAGLKYGAQAAARGTVRGGEAGRQAFTQRADAFAADGMPVTVGQAAGNKRMQLFEAGLGGTPGGHGPLSTFGEAQQAATKARVEQIAGGGRASAYEAGLSIQEGLRNYVSKFKKYADRRYDRLRQFFPEAPAQPAGPFSPGQPVQAQTFALGNTKQKLDALLSQYPSSPELAEILNNPTLKRMGEALPDQITFKEMQRLRSDIGRKLADGPLMSDLPRAELKALYASLSDDMLEAAKWVDANTVQPTPMRTTAVQALQEANDFFSAGLTKIEQNYEGLLAKVDPEQVYRTAVEGRASAQKITALMGGLKGTERQLLRETFLTRLGRAKGGAQDATGEVFSSETFLTNWSNLSNEAKTALFGNSTMRKELDTIAERMSDIRAGAKVLRNPSGTAGLGLASAAIFGAIGGIATGGIGPIAMVGAGIAGTHRLGKLMTDPAFISWLAKSTEIPAERLPGHVARLGTLSVQDEDAQALVQQLQANLSEVMPVRPEGGGSSQRYTAAKRNSQEAAPMALVRQHAQSLGVPVDVMEALAHTESSGGKFLTNTRSSARGPLQVIRGTFEEVNRKQFDGKLDWNSTHDQTLAGVAYFKSMMDRYNGDVELALAAYFVGPSKASSLIAQGGRQALFAYQPPKNDITVGGYIQKTLGR